MNESIIHPRALATARPSSLADRVDLVEDDDVQACIDMMVMMKIFAIVLADKSRVECHCCIPI